MIATIAEGIHKTPKPATRDGSHTRSISDSQAPAIADHVYGDLAQHGDIQFDPDHVALALHRAVRELRDRHPSAPMLWAPYIHVDP